MKLLDANGVPFDFEADDAETRAKLLELVHRMDGHPSRGLTPARIHAILQMAEQGDFQSQNELANDILTRDPIIFSEMSKRIRSTIKLPWDVVPPRDATSKEIEDTLFIKQTLLDFPDFEDLLADLLSAILPGFSCVELEWGFNQQHWLIKKANFRPTTWFTLDQETKNEIRLKDDTPDGAKLRDFGWIVHRHKAMSGYLTTSGLVRVLVWPYLFHNCAVFDLAEFLDIYGLPVKLGKYKSNATEAEKTTLLRAVMGVGHNAAAIMPDSMAIELASAASGSEKPFAELMNWAKNAICTAINGSTLTSNSGSTGLGSGLAEVHNEVRKDIRDADAKQLASTITRQLIFPLIQLNRGIKDFSRCPRFVLDVTENEDLDAFAKALPALVALGMQVPLGWAHEQLGIPVPEKNEAVLSVSGNANNSGNASPPLPKKNDAALREVLLNQAACAHGSLTGKHDTGIWDQQNLDAAHNLFANHLLSDVSDAFLKPAVDALLACPTAEAAFSLLSAENPATDTKVLQEALARVLFISHLFGGHAAVDDLVD